MKIHLVHFHGPLFFLRPQQHYRDENEWREAVQRFFASLARRDAVSSSSSRGLEHGERLAENPDADRKSSK